MRFAPDSETPCGWCGGHIVEELGWGERPQPCHHPVLAPLVDSQEEFMENAERFVMGEEVTLVCSMCGAVLKAQREKGLWEPEEQYIG